MISELCYWLAVGTGLALVVLTVGEVWGEEHCRDIPLAFEACVDSAESIEVKEWGAGVRLTINPTVIWPDPIPDGWIDCTEENIDTEPACTAVGEIVWQEGPPQCEPCPPTRDEYVKVLENEINILEADLAEMKQRHKDAVNRILDLEFQLTYEPTEATQ